MLRFVLIGIVAGSLCFPGISFGSPKSPVVIAVQTDHRSQIESAFIEESVRYLTSMLYNELIVVEPLTSQEIIEKASDRELNFVFAAPDTFAVLERYYGARALVSQALAPKIDPGSMLGATVISHVGKNKLTSINEIKDGTLLVEDPKAFFVKIFERELRQNGSALPKLKQLPALPGDKEEALDDFLKGSKTESILLPTGAFEAFVAAHPEAETKIYPLSYGAFSESHLVSSTVLYPGWTFAAFPSAPNNKVPLFSGVLLGMEGEDGKYDWTLSPSYEPVHELLQANQDPIYLTPGYKTWGDFLKEYWYLVLIPCVVIFGLIFHTRRSDALVQRRTKELINAMNEKQKMENEVKEYTERLMAMERLGIIGELSSMLAHELKQPLAAIHNYARGLAMHAEKNNVDATMLKKAIAKIDAQSSKASDIIDHVRSYAKGKTRHVKPIDFSGLFEKAVQNFAIARGVSVQTENTEGIKIEASALEMELLITNLLKNAAEAVEKVPDPWLGCALESEGDEAVLTVADNGPELTEKELERLEQPLQSTKSNGLGLGLVLVRRIAESSGGSVEFKKRSPTGLSVIVRLPLVKTSKGA